MDFHIFGEKADTVVVDKQRVRLLDVDERNGQLHICGANGERWVAIRLATFRGKPFVASDIDTPHEAAA